MATCLINLLQFQNINWSNKFICLKVFLIAWRKKGIKTIQNEWMILIKVKADFLKRKLKVQIVSTTFSVDRNVGPNAKKTKKPTFDVKTLQQIGRKRGDRGAANPHGLHNRNCHNYPGSRSNHFAVEEDSVLDIHNRSDAHSSNILRTIGWSSNGCLILQWRIAKLEEVFQQVLAAFLVWCNIPVQGNGASSIVLVPPSAVQIAFPSEAWTSERLDHVLLPVLTADDAPNLWTDARLASCRYYRPAGRVDKVPLQLLKRLEIFFYNMNSTEK